MIPGMERVRRTVARSNGVEFIPIIGAAAGLAVIGVLVAYFGADAVVRSLLAIGGDGFAAICAIHFSKAKLLLRRHACSRRAARSSNSVASTPPSSAQRK